ncbi:hypothetical protein GW17_00057609 [Ensete ventricosum]|nr:hypothetical protein GW17_00057609 [Ensete ventricosum]
MRCSGARLGARVRIHSRTITKPNGIAVRPRIEIPVRTGTRRSAQCPLGRVAARAARDGGNRPSTTEINRRRLILLLPPGSGRSAYRSAAGPVCTGRYGSYRSPYTLTAAISFAREERLNQYVRRTRPTPRPVAYKLPSTSNRPPQPKKLTREELRDRSAKGLCWHCDESWSRDHRCKKGRLLLIELADESEQEEDL